MVELKSSIEKKVEISLLMNHYGPLLTPHQQKVITLSNEEDFSLSEIAEQLNITRQGVHDTLSRGIKQLYHFENKLGLYHRSLKIEEHVQKALVNIKQVEANKANEKHLKNTITQLEQVLLQGDME